MRIRTSPKTFYTHDLLRHQRKVAISVLQTYAEILGVIGSISASDCSTITGGQGAQYSTNGKDFPMVDFACDVWLSAKKTLESSEFEFFKRQWHDKPIDLSVQDDVFMYTLEKLGRTFLGRGMYPVSSYFAVVKK